MRRRSLTGAQLEASQKFGYQDNNSVLVDNGVTDLDQCVDDGAGQRPELPPARLVKNARAAEKYAAEVMTALGYGAVRVAPLGADGGVERQV